jgi:hypothetical protein
MPTVFIGVSESYEKSLRYTNLLNRFSVERVVDSNVVRLVSHAPGLLNLKLTFKNPTESLAAFEFLTDLLQYDPAIKIDFILLTENPIEYVKKINEQLNPNRFDDLLQ